MEVCNPDKNGNKRARDDSEFDSVPPESKRVNSDRVGNDSVSDSSGVDLDSPAVKHLRGDILEILDEPEILVDHDPDIQVLDSVIKSFEEEILYPAPLPPEQTVIELTSSGSGESQVELGYLLEASDDELGLPPTVSSTKEQAGTGPVELPAGGGFVDNILEFGDGLPSYDTFDIGISAGMNEVDRHGGEFVAVGGLFDFPEPSDISEFLWRPETLPAS